MKSLVVLTLLIKCLSCKKQNQQALIDHEIEIIDVSTIQLHLMNMYKNIVVAFITCRKYTLVYISRYSRAN